MARIYADEDVPHPTVVRLRALGHDVLTVAEAGLANQKTPDEQNFAVALQEQRVMLTLNRRHFVRLHRHQARHYGIVVCRPDGNFDALAERIHRALSEAEPLEGKLMRVNRPA